MQSLFSHVLVIKPLFMASVKSPNVLLNVINHPVNLFQYFVISKA